MPEFKVKVNYKVNAGMFSNGEDRTTTRHTTAKDAKEAIQKVEKLVDHQVGGAKDLHVIDITTVDRIPNPPKNGKGGGKK